MRRGDDTGDLSASEPGDPLVHPERRVTMRRASERLLAQQAALLDLARDAIFALDADRRVTYWSCGAETCFGWTSDEALGCDGFALLRTEFPDPFGIEALLWREGHWDGELVKYTKAGERIVVDARLSGGYAPDGSAGPILVIATEITARKATERALDRERAWSLLLQRIAVAANLANHLADALRAAVTVICELLTWPVGQVSVLRADGALAPAPVSAVAARVLETRDVVWAPDAAPGEALGEEPRIEVRGHVAFPVLAGDEVVAVLEFYAPDPIPPDPALGAILRNVGSQLGRVHERQAARCALAENAEQLRLANLGLVRATEAKSSFLATMSHEIRTPMNAVVGMTGLLLDALDDPQHREFARAIRDSGESLLEIINDILDFSKIEAGRLDLEHRPFVLSDCVESAMDLVGQQAAAKSLDLVQVLDGSCPPTVIGDVTRVRQVLANLLSNAVKFTAAGAVSLRVEADGEDGALLRFSVSDTGMGIPPEGVDRLFHAFSQVDASTTRTYGGTGLGLAISRRLVEAMGGRLWVDTAAGHGSTFHFTARLPRDAGDSGQARPAESDAPVGEHDRPATAIPRPRSVGTASSGRLRVLVAEDNLVNQKVALCVLERLGHRVDVAANGLEAVVAVHRQMYDVVLMDVQMPELDGLDATRRIRAELPGDRQPYIIAMTANAFAEDRRLCISAGMDDYLSKPVPANALADALDKVLRGGAVMRAEV